MIFILEDEKRHGNRLSQIFLSSSSADRVCVCRSLHDFFRLSQKETADCVFSELEFADGSVFDILAACLHFSLIVVTSFGSEELAVKAMKSGAVDYVSIRSGKLPTATELLGRLSSENDGEKELRQEMQKQMLFTEALLSAVPTPVFFKDRQGRYIGCNRAFTEIMGVSTEQLRGKTVYELWPGEQALVYHKKDLELMEKPERQVYDFFVTDKDGRVRDVIFAKDVFFDAEGQVAGIVGAFLDIDERKQMEKRLADSEKRLSATLNSIGDAVIATDVNGQIIRMNNVAEKLTGWSLAEAFNHSLYEVFNIYNAHTGKKAKNPVKKVIATGKIQGLANHTVLRARNGKDYQIADSAAPIFDQAENLLGVVLVFRDVSAEYEIRAALEKERAQLLAIFDSISECICVTDMATHKIIYANRAMKKLFGPDLIGGCCYQVLQGNDSECGYCRELAERENKYAACRREYYNNLVERYFHVIDRLIQWPDGREVRFHLAIDITSQKKAEREKAVLEQQFNHAQKMESVGRLAGGMAHDLNNLLTPILCYGELLSMSLAHDEDQLDSVGEIMKAGFRARDLVQQLLAFSRKQVLRFEIIELNDEISSLVRLLRRTIPENVDIQSRFCADALFMKGDSAQLEQVLMNLVVNAWDAMPEGGVLSIETSLVELDQVYAELHQEIKPGKYVLLEVCDSGTGMSPEVRLKIFEPFFSTKEKGKGTGLGLATSYGIVKQHGGHIWVYSEEGKGSCFKVYFPFCPPVTEERKSDDGLSAQDSAALGLEKSAVRETILLVEDSEPVRKLVADVLGRNGYTVLTAGNGELALSLLEEQGVKPELLLTDVIMPKMNGRQLFSALRTLYPELKVIYMSGYTENVIARHGVLDEGMCFIQKPFSVKILSEMVTKVLRG